MNKLVKEIETQSSTYYLQYFFNAHKYIHMYINFVMSMKILLNLKKLSKYVDIDDFAHRR